MLSASYLDGSASDTLVSDAMAYGHRLAHHVNHEGLRSAGKTLLILCQGGSQNVAAIRGTLRRVLELLKEVTPEDWTPVSVQGWFGTSTTHRFPVHATAVRAALGDI